MGFPLVMIPGLLCTRELFAGQMADLADVADCIVADTTDHDTIAGIAEATLELAPESFALAGLSMGGYVAFEIMRQAPRRVVALALLDTNARPDTPEQTARRAELVTLAEQEGIAVVIDQLLPNLVDESRLDEYELVETVRRMAGQVGVEAFARQEKAIMNRVDSGPTLGDIACPTMVLVGDRDMLAPPQLSEEMANAIHGARFEIVPHCGHLSAIERPEAVTAALRRLLEEVA